MGQVIANPEFRDILVRNVGIGANVHHPKEVVMQLRPVPFTHQVYHLPGHEGLAQSHLIGQQDTTAPQVFEEVQNTTSRSPLEIFHFNRHGA
jgi:hypothetical protein